MTTTIAKEILSSIKPKKIALTASEALIRFLSNQKIETEEGIVPLFGGIWSIFGHGNVAGIGEAICRYKKELPFFRGQNEQGMAHAAIAFAKINRCRRMMAVTTSIGPGATNLLTAAALAYVNRLPVLFLPGDIYVSRRPDPVLQQSENTTFPGESVNDCFKPVSVLWDRIVCPEQLSDLLPKIPEMLLNPLTRGPVTICLPQDVQSQTGYFFSSLFEEIIHTVPRQRADRRQIQKAIELISSSKRPLIIAGGGVHYSLAEEVLQKFAENHGIPVCETQAGKGSLLGDHPLNLSGIGVTGTKSANRAAETADLIIAIGTRLNDFITASKSLFPDKKILGININSFDSIKCRGVSCVSDALEALEEISSGLNYSTTQQYRKEINDLKIGWENTYNLFTVQIPGTSTSDAQVVATVNRTIDPKDIVVAAAGGIPGELNKFWKVRDRIGYHCEYGYSCMGYEIAGGLGVKIARPDREVYIMTGDGSYLMMHTELLTSLQLGYKINVILLDNKGFGCIHRLQTSSGISPYGNLFKECKSVDFVANASSYGCYAVKVRDCNELEKQIHENKNRTESCVIVIETDPDKASPGSAWWDVAIAEGSPCKEVQNKRFLYEKKLNEIS